MIDDKLPEDWQDLQNKVAEILADIGFETEIEKELITTRGKTEVDVFAVDESQSPPVTYLCECKHWESKIPQTIIHSFRTVVQDYGANFGLIISKRGFQSGAYEAVKNTNIKLVNWYEFQDIFEDKWFPAITDKLYNDFERLCDYTEPLIPTSICKKLDKMSEKEVDVFKKLRRKYQSIGSMITHLKYGRMHDEFWKRIKFPFDFPIPSDDTNDEKSVKVHCFREYIDFFASWGKEGLREFNALFKEN